MIVPVIIGSAIVGTAVVKHLRQPPKMSARDKEIYYNALKFVKEPEKLETLSASFIEKGYVREGELLQKRANLRRLKPEEREKRKAIFKRAISSTNKKAVLKVADRFEQDGATGAAWNLRKYASQLP